jgi:hypothetical protein
MAIKKPVNKVEVSWTATAGTDSNLVRKMCLGSCREGGHFLMAYVYPLNVVALADRFGHAVE